MPRMGYVDIPFGASELGSSLIPTAATLLGAVALVLPATAASAVFGPDIGDGIGT